MPAKAQASVTSDSDSILASTPTIANGEISVAIKENAQVGQSAKISISVSDSNHTVATPAVFTVSVKQEGYSFTLLGTPKTVNLGEDISLSGFQIKTNYDSGRPSTTDTVKASMLSGYDKIATGAGSIGKKIITLKLDAKRQTSFEIDVLDVTTDLVVTPPTTLNYRWGIDTQLNLTGGTVKAVKRSSIEQPTVPMTAQMVSITDSTIQNISDTLVSVTHEGFKKPNLFTVKVRAEGNVVASPDDLSEQPGVAAVLPKDASQSDKDKLSWLKFVVDLGNPELFTQALKNMNGMTAMDISLVDENGNTPKLPKGTKYTVMMPFPAGTDSSYTMERSGNPARQIRRDAGD